MLVMFIFPSWFHVLAKKIDIRTYGESSRPLEMLIVCPKIFNSCNSSNLMKTVLESVLSLDKVLKPKGEFCR